MRPLLYDPGPGRHAGLALTIAQETAHEHGGELTLQVESNQ
jgi:hypothetical protein